MRVDIPNRTLDLVVDGEVASPAMLEERRADWKPIEPRYTRGVLAKYAKLAGSAEIGASLE